MREPQRQRRRVVVTILPEDHQLWRRAALELGLDLSEILRAGAHLLIGGPYPELRAALASVAHSQSHPGRRAKAVDDAARMHAARRTP